MISEGIKDVSLKEDINKIDYKNNELDKDLSEILSLKKELEKKYTIPVSQEEIDFALKNKIDTLKENRNQVSLLLKESLNAHTKAKELTEDLFKGVKEPKIKVDSNVEIK